jgi:hypothetical protein
VSWHSWMMFGWRHWDEAAWPCLSGEINLKAGPCSSWISATSWMCRPSPRSFTERSTWLRPRSSNHGAQCWLHWGDRHGPGRLKEREDDALLRCGRRIRRGRSGARTHEPFPTRKRSGNRRWQPRRKPAPLQTRTQPSQGRNTGSSPGAGWKARARVRQPGPSGSPAGSPPCKGHRVPSGTPPPLFLFSALAASLTLSKASARSRYVPGVHGYHSGCLLLQNSFRERDPRSCRAAHPGSTPCLASTDTVPFS